MELPSEIQDILTSKVPRGVLSVVSKAHSVEADVANLKDLIHAPPSPEEVRECIGELSDTGLPFTMWVKTGMRSFDIASTAFDQCIRCIKEGSVQLYNEDPVEYARIWYDMSESILTRVDCISMIRLILWRPRVKKLSVAYPVLTASLLTQKATEFLRNDYVRYIEDPVMLYLVMYSIAAELGVISSDDVLDMVSHVNDISRNSKLLMQEANELHEAIKKVIPGEISKLLQ